MTSAPALSAGGGAGEASEARPLERGDWIGAGAIGAVAAVLALGSLLQGSIPQPMFLLVAAVLALPALVALATTRFPVLVLGLLALRPAVDQMNGLEGRPPVTLALGAGFLLVALTWLGVQWANRSLYPASALVRGLVVFLIALALSVPGAHDPIRSGTAYLQLAGGLLMLVVLEQLVMAKALTHHQVAGCLIASSVIPVVAAIRIALSHPPPDELLGFVRIQGTFPHPSPFATYLVFLVVASSVLLVRSRPAVRLALIVLVLVSVVMIAQTYTRIAWLGLVVGMLLIGLNRHRKLLGAVLVAGVLLVVCVPQITARFSDIGDEAPVVGVASNSVAWRFGYWHQVAELGNTSPFTGAGLDTVNEEFPDRVEPHSLWFQLYGETGLVGLVAAIGVMVITGRALRRAKRDARSDGELDWVVIGIVAGALYLFMGSTENFLLSNIQNWYGLAWVVLAVNARVVRDGRAQGPAGPESIPGPEESGRLPGWAP